MSRLRPSIPWFRLAPLPSGNAIADSSVDSSGLQDCAVSTQAIQDSAIDSSKLQDCAVSYQSIQNVTAQRLLGREDNAAGSPQEIALSAELRFDTDNDWLEIADSGILTGLIKDSAVTTAKLLDSAVDSTKIADSAVSSAGIQDGTIVAADFYDTHIPSRVVQLVVTDTTFTTGDSQFHFFVPAELDSFNLVRAEAVLGTASTTGNPTFQIRNVTTAADMLSTKITIDTAEKTSYTAATPSVVDGSNDSVVTGNELSVDVDSAGAAPEWLGIILTFRKP